MKAAAGGVEASNQSKEALAEAGNGSEPLNLTPPATLPT